MRHALLASLVAGAVLAGVPATADPVVGLGLTFWFGSGQTQTGIGLRVFSDDQNESVVGSVGVDYILQNQAIVPTLGIAYRQDDAYVGLDLGFDLAGGPLRSGAGLGVTQTADAPVAAAPVTPPVVSAPVVTLPPVETADDLKL